LCDITYKIVSRFGKTFAKMRRIQGNFGSRDPEEDRKKSRESVIANLVLYGSIVLIIRVGGYNFPV
jgi:hypothetical protein